MHVFFKLIAHITSAKFNLSEDESATFLADLVPRLSCSGLPCRASSPPLFQRALLQSHSSSPPYLQRVLLQSRLLVSTNPLMKILWTSNQRRQFRFYFFIYIFIF